MSQTVISEERVIDESRKAVAEALQIDVNTVKRDSSLIKDLGAESLDFLDINYRLEQAFGIKLPRHTVLEHVEEIFGEESAIDGDGKLTGRAVALLELRFGGRETGLREGLDVDEVPGVITVESMAHGVMDVLSSMSEACPACSASAWTAENGTRAKCGSCGAYAEFKNGDDLIQEWLERVQKEKGIF